MVSSTRGRPAASAPGARRATEGPRRPPASAVSRRHDDRQRLPAPDRRCRRELGAVEVDLPLGEPLQHLLEGDAALEPCEGGAEAEVEAEAERQVSADLS